MAKAFFGSILIYLHIVFNVLLKFSCSTTVIEDISRHCHNHISSACAYAYFYFDFSDSAKQHSDKMLSSLIYQFVCQSHTPEISSVLDKLYAKNEMGKRQPLTSDLITTLGEILTHTPQSYIILDALDECMDREKLWLFLKSLKDSLNRGTTLHLLMTSRRERDIVEQLSISKVLEISITADAVNQDIELYIKSRLQSNLKLKRWSSKMNNIESTLRERSGGMCVNFIFYALRNVNLYSPTGLDG